MTAMRSSGQPTEAAAMRRSASSLVADGPFEQGADVVVGRHGQGVERRRAGSRP